MQIAISMTFLLTSMALRVSECGGRLVHPRLGCRAGGRLRSVTWQLQTENKIIRVEGNTSLRFVQWPDPLPSRLEFLLARAMESERSSSHHVDESLPDHRRGP